MLHHHFNPNSNNVSRAAETERKASAKQHSIHGSVTTRNKQGPDLQNILWQSYDSAKVMMDFDERLTYKTSYHYRNTNLRYKTFENLIINN